MAKPKADAKAPVTAAGKPRARVGRPPKQVPHADPSMPRPQDLVRNLAAALGLHVQRVWIVKDDQMVERSAVIL
jgi:hypothetical protein